MEDKQLQYKYFPTSQRNKGSQTLGFGQLVQYNATNTFLQNYAEIEARRLFQELFLFF